MVELSYWRWLLRGSGGKPGFTWFLDLWLPVHAMVGLVLALAVPVPLASAATAVLLPLVAAMIGLSFAWSGNAQALMATEEIENLATYSKGGLPDFVYLFQTAIVVLIGALVAWSLAGLEVFDKVWPRGDSGHAYLAVKCVVYFLTSLAVRECWAVVVGAQSLLLARSLIRKQGKSGQGGDKAGGGQGTA